MRKNILRKTGWPLLLVLAANLGTAQGHNACLPSGLDVCEWESACSLAGMATASEETEESPQRPRKDDVMDIIHLSNQYWQSTNPGHGNYFWNRAVYHIGNMEAYRTTGETVYLDFSTAWAEHNNWSGPAGDDPSKWSYDYGENNVLFGDCQVCFQVYAELYDVQPEERRIARAKQVFGYQLGTTVNDYLYWVDGLFMVMPAMTHLYNLTQDETYLEKMYDYWTYANSIMYDEETGLYYRDAKYVYPEHTTNSGKKDFWARGDGWMFAAYARILADLPADHTHRDEYITYYKRMAETLAGCQQDGGYWTRSLLDPSYAPGYETSGTSLILYGYLWGVNNGILDGEKYASVIANAWTYLSETALQENGRVGYVQPIGEKADPNQTVGASSTGDFGVGAYLLAACEMYRYAVDDPTPRPLRLTKAVLESPTRLVLTFNEEVDAAEGLDAENYTINGEPADAAIQIDGKSVTLTFASPLSYGHPELSVSGLSSKKGGLMEGTATRSLVLPVALYPNYNIVTVTASGNQYGNPPAHTIDSDLSTRWSHDGIGQWLCFDLGGTKTVTAIDLAFYQGAQRNSYFDIQASADGTSYQTVLEGQQSCGQTDSLERFDLAPVETRYIRIWCKGNSTGGEQWNSITEARVVAESAPVQTTYEGEVVAPEGAWCWFADPRAVHYENEGQTINSTYVGYIDTHGNIKAMQYDFLRQERKEVLIRSYFQPDDHNNPTFLILPDERIMVFYSRHTDEPCFYYRVTREKGDLATLGEEKAIATADNTTYPSPFILSDDPEHIYLCWRGINWHPTIARLSLPDAEDNVEMTWGPYQMVQSSGARPYAKYFSNGKDQIMLAYTAGHPDNEYPNPVYFNTVDIHTMQLKDVAGRTLANIEDGAFNVDKTDGYADQYPATIVDRTADKRDWLWQVAVTEEGAPAILLTKISEDKTSHDYYLSEWNGTEWVQTFLANGGGAFHQTAGLEECYSAGMAMAPHDPHEIYASLPVGGLHGMKYEIFKIAIGEDGEVAKEQVTSNSSLNNVRPYVIPGAEDSPLKLVWMHGNYYDWIVSSAHPEGYPTAIHCNYAWEYASTDLENSLVLHETFEGIDDGETYNNESTARVESGILTTDKDQHAALQAVTGSFTLSLSLQVSHYKYYGDIVSCGNLAYGLDSLTQKPYVRIGEQRFDSSNKLGTSDTWQTQERATNGLWYDLEKLNFFNLTLTCSDGLLTTYVNGWVDQQIECPGFTPADGLRIGGFKGWVEDFHLYSRVLNPDEIKLLAESSRQYTLPDGLKIAEELGAMDLPEKVFTDIPLPAQTASGHPVVWQSSNASILTADGIATLPESATGVVLTATSGSQRCDYNLTVFPRDIQKNIVLHYTFDPQDVYEKNGGTYLADHSGNGRDAEVKGDAAINGTLDLTRNQPMSFHTNGYLIAPSGILGGMRSYTFLAKVTPDRLDRMPRFYDFGSSSGNSVFGRANGLAAGVKYDGGSTALVEASTQLKTGEETFVAFTFDAGTQTTSIYLDGELVGSGTGIAREPFEVAAIAADQRNYIGRTQWWDSHVAADNVDFCGKMDDFYTFDIALTQDEIRELQLEDTSVDGFTADNGNGGGWKLSAHACTPGSPLQVVSATKEEGCCLRIFSSNGQMVEQFTHISSGTTFNAPEGKGVYLLHIATPSGKNQTEKLIVK